MRLPRPPRPPDTAASDEELGRVLLAEHTVPSVLRRVAELAGEAVPGAEEVSVTLLTDDRPQTLVATGALGRDLDERQCALGSGPCRDGARAGERVVIEDTASETPWSGYVRAAVERGARGSSTVPVPLQHAPAARLDVCPARPRAVDPAAQDHAGTSASDAGVAPADRHRDDSARQLATQLEQALASRPVVEQANDVLVGLRWCVAPEAFDLLGDLSHRSDRRLRDVARGLVDDTAGTTTTAEDAAVAAGAQP